MSIQEIHDFLSALGFDADNLTVSQAVELLHMEHHLSNANEGNA